MPYFGTVPSTASFIKQEKDPLSRRVGYRHNLGSCWQCDQLYQMVVQT